MDWKPEDVVRVEAVILVDADYANITWLHTSGQAVISTRHPLRPQVEYLLGRAEREGVVFERCD